jgi:hypothetical protein
MSQESAHAIQHFGAEDVLELAGTRFHMAFLELENLGEQPLGQAMPADDLFSAPFPFVQKYYSSFG